MTASVNLAPNLERSSYIFVDSFIAHGAFGELAVHSLLQSSVCKGSLKVMAKFHPDSFIIISVHQYDPIRWVTVTFGVQLLGLLKDPIVNRQSLHE